MPYRVSQRCPIGQALPFAVSNISPTNFVKHIKQLFLSMNLLFNLGELCPERCDCLIVKRDIQANDIEQLR